MDGRTSARVTVKNLTSASCSRALSRDYAVITSDGQDVAAVEQVFRSGLERVRAAGDGSKDRP